MITQIGKDLKLAKELLDKNELVAIPTETVYGLAGNALNSEAVAKIYAVKHRPHFNPLILHVHNIENLKRYTKEFPPKIEKLMLQFMPGPLTVILPKSNLVPDIATAGSQNVAIRIPRNILTLQLLEGLDYPLAAPSANLSGFVSPTKADHVVDSLDGKIPYILDGGDCSIGLESTIVGYDAANDKVVVHRLGGLSKVDIEACLGEGIVDYFQDSFPSAPGQLQSHYATKTPLIVGDIEELTIENSDAKLALINYSEEKNVSVFKQYVLTPTNRLGEAAHNLFDIMRQADQSGADFILAEYAPEEGIGMAINDRLYRAQHELK